MSIDPDQKPCSVGSFWVCTVCSGLSMLTLSVNMVHLLCRKHFMHVIQNTHKFSCLFQPSVSLLATALTASPQRLSPNPDITLPISIEPPSPSNRNPLTPAAESPRISSPKSPGLYFPESPVSQKSDLDLSFSPPQSPKIAEQSKYVSDSNGLPC